MSLANDESFRARAILLGWMAQGCLSGMLIVLGCSYLLRHRHKNLYTSWLVLTILLLNTAATILAYCSVWNTFSITDPAENSRVRLPLTNTAGVMLDMLSVVLVQCFFAKQAWMLSQRKVIIALILVLVMSAQIACVIWEMVILGTLHLTNNSKVPSSVPLPVLVSEPYNLQEKYEDPLLLSIRARNISTTACTLIPACIICSVLIRGKRLCFTQSMRSLVTATIRLSILCAAIPTLVAVLALTLSFGTHYNPISAFCFLILGRVYAITLMWALNDRAALKASHREGKPVLPNIRRTRSFADRTRRKSSLTKASLDLTIVEEVEESVSDGLETIQVPIMGSYTQRAPSIHNHDQCTSREDSRVIAPFLDSEPRNLPRFPALPKLRLTESISRRSTNDPCWPHTQSVP